MTGGKLDPISVPATSAAKAAVRDFWEIAACGEVYVEGERDRAGFDAQRQARYALEPFILPFASFAEARNVDVLEIGVGMGADHLEWAAAEPRSLIGLDLTIRAVETTRERAAVSGIAANLFVGDAENLAFPDDCFDIVYSWGVLHHSPDTPAAFAEIRRVLRPSGVARVMVYHRASIVGVLLWLRYAFARGRLGTSLDDIYSSYLESPGTKAYSRREINRLLVSAGFQHVKLSVELSSGDLLKGAAGQRHHGYGLSLARSIWPRRLIARFGRRLGLFLLIEAG